jgi:hypothetical protein
VRKDLSKVNKRKDIWA